MRVNEACGVHDAASVLSAEAFREQRLQELRDLAEWRSRRIAAYAAWSDPKAVAERKATHEKAAPAALEMGRQLSAIAEAQMIEAMKERAGRPRLEGIRVTPVVPANVEPPRRSWWQRLMAWLRK